MTDKAADFLNQFVGRISEVERLLLPRKKQRALEEMETVLDKFLKQAARNQDQERFEHYQSILDMLRNADPDYQPDWDEVAARWLDIIRPMWYQRLQQPRNRPLLLKDIQADLLNSEEEFGGALIDKFRSFPVLPGVDERISACIVGVE